jgi:hypothetical protein
MLRRIAKTGFPILAITVSSSFLSADPLTSYDSYPCVFTLGWPAVGSKATCQFPSEVCVFTSVESGVTKVCY